jgi:hypothetical protein
MAPPPKEVDTSTSRRTRLGCENAICRATAPPNEAPSTCTDSRPNASSTAVPIWASDHMLSGYGGRCDRPMPGGSNAIEEEEK